MKLENFISIRIVNIHYSWRKVLFLTLLFLLPVITPIRAMAQVLTLKQCIDTALQNNRNLSLSSQDILLASEKRKEVAGNLLPKINASADYRYYTDLPYQLMPASVFGGPAGTYKEVQFGVPQTLAANLQLNVPVVNPAVLGALKTTKVATELTDLQHIKTEEDVILDVSQAYFNAQILLSQITFLDTNIFNMAKLIKTTSLLYEQQVVKKTDVDRIQLQLDQLNSKRTTLYAQYRQVTNVLEFLMGRLHSNTLEVMPVTTLIKETNYIAGEITDLRLIEKKLQFNRSELTGFKLSRLPSLSAYAMYGTTGLGNTGENSFFNFYPVSFVGVQLSVPLFNGTVTQRRINQKKIEITKTSIQLDLATDRNRMESDNAHRQYLAAKEFLATTIAQIELAENIFNSTVLQNQQGVASITDVLIADNSHREAQQNYSSALISLFRAELEMQRVTGNLINN